MIIAIIFLIGYTAIAFEHSIGINKAATSLITGILCWVVYSFGEENKELVNEQLVHHLGELSGILFFLLGAMTIVELIDAHDGFEILTQKITTTKKRKLLWLTALIAFFLSAVLDNLTTTIVMIALLRKLIHDQTNRLFFIGIIIIAANAGGAWSPIGDITTTMLWMGGQISAGGIMIQLFLPSIICLILPLSYLSLKLKGDFIPNLKNEKEVTNVLPRHQQLIVLFSGIVILLLIPVFKTITHLPPYMGILLGLGLLWVITEIIHGKKDEEDKHSLSVVFALRKIDSPSILFFLGILLSIASLQVSGILTNASDFLANRIGDIRLIAYLTGLFSSIVDNVPLVAASQGMYDMNTYPQDHFFWEALAFCSGTGGSILIIGSAAGVAAMGIEKISFGWYVRKISFWAFIGYTGGYLSYILQFHLLQ